MHSRFQRFFILFEFAQTKKKKSIKICTNVLDVKRETQ